MNEIPTYSARWIGRDLAGLPAVSAHALAKEDRQARREAEEAAGRESDRLDAAAVRAQLEGRDVSLAGVFDRAERSMRKTDHEAEKVKRNRQIESGEVAVLDAPRASRSAAAETDRLLTRYRELRADLAAYRRRRGEVSRWSVGVLSARSAPLALLSRGHPSPNGTRSRDRRPVPEPTPRRVLEELGYDEPSPDGCPVCADCRYVICRCGGQAPDVNRASRAGRELTRGCEDAIVGVR